MKNLQIGDNDLIGSKFNGHDLHIYLREKGWDSSHIVANKDSDDENTFFISNMGDYPYLRDLYRLHESFYSIYSMMYPFVYDIIYDSLFLETDIVHYHLIHNHFFNINLLPVMTKLKPSVWTLHDPWTLTGHCIYPIDCEKWQTGCGDCPNLDISFPMYPDNSAFNFELKRQTVQNSNISVIVASEWMKNKVEQSPIFKGKPVYHVPFGINQELFCPEDKSLAKEKLGIDKDAVTIMFRCDPSPFKGVEYIKEALTRLKSERKITLISVATMGLLEEYKDKFNIIEYDWIKDDKMLIQLYQACDIFLMPSKEEAFGLMAVEAMSCGKMVLAIEGTSLKKVINAPECGIVTPRNLDNYANELQRLIDNPAEIEQRGLKSLEFARQNYNHEIYVDRIINVYNEVIANHTLDTESKHVLEQLKKHMIDFNIKKKSRKKPKKLTEKLKYLLFRRPILRMIYSNDQVKLYYDKRNL